ncbi:hypothetical protein GALMADRAFT_148705 [Galerina marginata CBS 339.88]|uniref:Uncharacterized protein n=1 Tax=Galerina marginata (strain CBS 339.88) TaxID=685588 RepID=A0A067S3P0_GALM3|nr:hypothetical protein GALMADRAFT_148705 [Galerina marginata CBS 339.88]
MDSDRQDHVGLLDVVLLHMNAVLARRPWKSKATILKPAALGHPAPARLRPQAFARPKTLALSTSTDPHLSLSNFQELPSPLRFSRLLAPPPDRSPPRTTCSPQCS